MPALPASNFLLSLGWAILNSFWQMALIWVIFRAVLFLFPRLRSSVRTGIATGLVLGGFVWFLFTLFTSFGQVSDARLFVAQLGDDNLIAQVRANLLPLLPYAGILYLALLVVPVRQFIINYRYLQLIRQHGLSRIQGEWKIFTARMSSYIGVRRPVQVWISSLVKSPVTVGFLRPMILIPLAAVNHLDMRQMESVLLHELAHIRRKDYLFNFLLTIIQSLLYFNPFVRWMIQQIEEDRESSCDQLVIQFGYNAHSYATALLALEKGWPGVEKQALSMAMAATGGNRGLMKRIEQIVGIPTVKKWWTPGHIAGICSAILLVLFSQVLVLHTPANDKAQGLTLHEWVAGHFTWPTNKKEIKEVELPKSALAAVRPAAFTESKTPLLQSTSPEAVKQEYVRYPAYNDPAYQYVSFREPVEPALTAEEEAEVDNAVEVSRRLVQEMEWEEMRKQYADALTRLEQERMKKAHLAQFNAQDWADLEKKLRLQYEQINWEQLNGKLDMAMAGIQMDSVIHEVAKAQEKVRTLEGLMKSYELASIPDTDLSLETLKKEEERLRKEMDQLKKVRTRKIVRL